MPGYSKRGQKEEKRGCELHFLLLLDGAPSAPIILHQSPFMVTLNVQDGRELSTVLRKQRESRPFHYHGLLTTEREIFNPLVHPSPCAPIFYGVGIGEGSWPWREEGSSLLKSLTLVLTWLGGGWGRGPYQGESLT